MNPSVSNEFPRPQSKSETASGEPTTQEQIAELIRRLEAGDVSLDHVSTTEDLVCNGVDAMRILSIRPEIFLERIWAGRVTSSLSVSGELAGHLYVSGIVDMDIKVSGALSGDLYTFGSGCVVGSILVRGTVGGDLQVIDSSEVRGGIGIVNSGFVAGNVAVKHSGCVGKSVVVEGATGKSLSVADSGSVLGDVFMTTHSSVGEHLSITTDGSIGNLVVAGAATVGDTLYVADTVRVDGVLSLGGSVVGVTTLSCDAQVISMRTSFQSSAFLGEGISLASCDFRGFTRGGLDRLLRSRRIRLLWRGLVVIRPMGSVAVHGPFHGFVPFSTPSQPEQH